MSKRIRLTHKSRMAESQADGLFPGDVGNMERSKAYRDIDQYHTFEQTVNHELPDMRHEWKEDKRDENNIPVPKVAELYAAAQNAIKLAMMFLGDKATEKMVQAQARDFMKLGNTRLVASMNRWYETEEDEVVAEDECQACDETITSEDEVEAQEETVEETVEVTQEEIPAEQPVTEVAEDEVVAEDQVETEEEIVQDEMFEQSEDEEEIEVEEELELDEEGEDLNTEVDFDVEENEVDAQVDAELEAIFEDEDTMVDDQNDVVAKKVASKKQGVKRIAGQPKLVRVASKKVDELEGIWTKLDRPGMN